MSERPMFDTIDECVAVDPQVWSRHVEAFRTRAQEELRLALISGDERDAEHWRLRAHVMELDPRDWLGYGLLNRWHGTFQGAREDCSSGCAYYVRLKGDLSSDWGVCSSPVSHRMGKLTFEHQGCYAFEPGPDL